MNIEYLIALLSTSQVVWALRFMLGLLLVVSGALKLPNLQAFRIVVSKYSVIPRGIWKPREMSFPFVEILVGAWMLMNVLPEYAALGTLILLIFSTILLVVSLIKKKPEQASGHLEAGANMRISWMNFFENLFWVGLSFWLVVIFWAQWFYL